MSTKKKILLLTDWYEPGFKAGGPIQSCRNFVRALHDEFEISIITGDRDHGDTQPYQGIAANTWITKDNGVRIWYAGPGTLKPGPLKRLITAITPDYIYLNSMYSYHFTLLPLWLKWRKQIAAGIVIAPRGMLQAGAMQFKSGKKKLLLKLLNTSGLPGKLIFQATDSQEKEDIERYLPSAGKILVIANFPKMNSIPWSPTPKRPGELHCVFISRLAPKKNLLFLLEVLENLPDTIRLRLNLYGEIEDQRYWKKCLSAIEGLPSHITVDWKGSIPNEAVPEVLQQHHIFVLPTKGENFGHAIFESLALGRPVLISDRTPWRNLESGHTGWDLSLDRPDLFRQSIEKAASFDQEEYDHWSRSAYLYIKDFVKRSDLKKDYLKLFNQEITRLQ
ncbi:MAG TPA: glycosyltransferase family 4 protein [Puia sp.]|nr:glycosyltransferase family 4 protein [Puia sp.]